MTELDYSIINDFNGTADGDFTVLGDMQIKSGRISAFDPYVEHERLQRFGSDVQPGRYRVAAYGDHDLVFMRFTDAPAVRWADAVFTDREELPPDEGSDRNAYIVDSGNGCFVDAEIAARLNQFSFENEWMIFGDKIPECEGFFYFDFGDHEFVDLTSRILGTEREIRRLAGWQETLTAMTPAQRFEERIGLYKDFKSLSAKVEHVRNAEPDKGAALDRLTGERSDLINRLSLWTEQHAFQKGMEWMAEEWRERPQDRFRFSRFRSISFPGLDGLNAITFSTSYGDGIYPSYWGYDEYGSICQLVTQFDEWRSPVSNDDDVDVDNGSSPS
jgi:hypothetical protein